MEEIKKWLNDGYGSGYGYVSGYDYGSGSGSGYGSGYVSGYGSGYGYVSGSGSGYGYGDGLGFINGKEIFIIDGIQTTITRIKDNVAVGFIVEPDLTLTPCFVIKGQGYFAHGKNLKEAREALTAKIFENMDIDETIEQFIRTFDCDEKYPGTTFFEWHHYLTGSCLMGRESFVKNRDINLDDMFTVKEFIDICKNDYGGQVIRQLAEKLNMEI